MESRLRTTRPTYYREQAVRLRELVEDLPVGRFREQLLSVAGEYDQLADSIERRMSGTS
jgi:hypothetical protein